MKPNPLHSVWVQRDFRTEPVVAGCFVDFTITYTPATLALMIPQRQDLYALRYRHGTATVYAPDQQIT